MQGQGAVAGHYCDDIGLRRIVAELLWLVSVGTEDPGAAALRRRFVLGGLSAMAELDATKPILRDAFYPLMLGFGAASASVTYLTGDFVSTLLDDTLNAWDPNTNSFLRRGNLRSLIRELLSNPPSELVSAAQTENLSDLTCQNEGITADTENVRGMVHGQPAQLDIAGLHLQRGTAVQVPLGEDSFAGGLHLSAGTPEDQPMPSDAIIARFRAGDFNVLTTTQQPERVIAALSSSIQVMRSLLSTSDISAEPDSNETQGNSEDDFSNVKPKAQEGHSEGGKAGGTGGPKTL